MAKVAGVDVLVKVKVATAFVALGGQKGASLTKSAKTIDVTDKNSGGWSESMAGILSWKVDCEGFVVLGDSAFEQLQTSFAARTAIDVEIREGANVDTGGVTYTGKAVIVDLSEDFNADDAVSIKISLEGASPLTRTVGVVT